MTDLSATDAGCPSGLAPPTPAGVAGDPSPFVVRKGNVNQIDLSIRGAKCGGCLSKIEKSVRRLPGITEARLNLSNGQMGSPGQAICGRTRLFRRSLTWATALRPWTLSGMKTMPSARNAAC